MLCASSVNIYSSELPKDTVDKYVIDNVAIHKFDGTQLENKTISKYIIAYKDLGNVVEKKHVIITNQNSSAQSNTDQKNFNGLIIVDGKEIKNSDLAKINNKDIKSMYVLKAGSEAAEAYGEKGKNGVMLIKTKTAADNKTAEEVYYIDGKKVDKSRINNLKSENIASVSVVKNEKGEPSTIYIKTKKDK